MSWQPIETLPTTEGWFILWDGNDRLIRAHRRATFKRWFSGGLILQVKTVRSFKYWMLWPGKDKTK